MAKGMPDGVRNVMGWSIGVAIVALVVLIFVIIFGNLSGNVGFATSTQGYNDTENVILNYTSSAVNTAKQFPTVGTILGVVILLSILIGLLVYVITKVMGVANKAGGSNGNFG